MSLATSKKLKVLIPLPLLISLALGCKKTSFQSIESKPDFTRVSQSLNCDDEKQTNIEIKNPKTNALMLAKSCSVDASSSKTPADIIFVIDITGSMEDSLNTVKNGVERFATKLRQDKGWDARFAAIGFRDKIAAQVPFTDEKSLTDRVQDWEADGGDDPQEGGQFALAAAVEMLNRDASSTPDRASATKHILFIGDAVGFDLNNDHQDFSTGRLERIFAAIPETLKSKIKFHYSAAREVPICERASFFGCARMGKSEKLAAYGQISQLAKNINIPGKSFDFPFTENILLNEFIDEFTPGQSCSLKSAIIKDASGNEVGKIGESGSFDFPKGIKLSSFNVEVERCCAALSTRQSAASSDPVSKATPGPNCRSEKRNFGLLLKK